MTECSTNVVDRVDHIMQGTTRLISAPRDSTLVRIEFDVRQNRFPMFVSLENSRLTMANVLEEVRTKLNEADALALKNLMAAGKLYFDTVPTVASVVPRDDQQNLLTRTRFRIEASGCRSLNIFALDVSTDIPTRPEDDLDRPPLLDDVTVTPEPDSESESESESDDDFIWIMIFMGVACCLLIMFLFLMSSIY
jgi:hypothetical protein